MTRSLERFYFGAKERRLYGALSVPTDRPARAGVVVCPPFGEEMVNTYGRLARWAKESAEAGIAVLRFHPYGTGESDGSFSDFHLEGAAEDLVTALGRLKEATGLERVGLLGVRFGAAVALQATQLRRPSFAAMWCPVLDCSSYMRELLRFKLTSDMTQQQGGSGPKVTMKALVAELTAGKTIDVVDYEYSPELYRQLSAPRTWSSDPPSDEVLLIARPMEDGESFDQLAAWKERSRRFEHAIVKVPVFWEDFTGGLPAELGDETRAWILAGAQGGGEAAERVTPGTGRAR